MREDRGRMTNRRNSNGPMSSQGRNVVPLTMSREEETIEMEIAQSQLGQLLAECAAPGTGAIPESWNRVRSGKKANGVFLWEKRSTQDDKKHKWGPLSTPSQQDNGLVTYSVRSSTTVSAPIEMVLKTLDASMATAHRSFTRTIYGNLVADMAVLYHSSAHCFESSASHEDDSLETLAVRWFVCRCSNPIVYDCAFCLQEYTKRHSIDELSKSGGYFNNNKVDDDSRGGNHQGLHPIGETPVAYKVFWSTETRHCFDLLASPRVVRCTVPLGGFLLYPTDNSDKTDVVFYMTIAQDDANVRGENLALSNSVSTRCSDRQFRAFQSVVRQMARQIGRLDNAVESYKLSMHLESLRSLQWVHNTERNECIVCYRRFHQLTRRRHHCRLCGEVICRECSVHKNVDLPICGPTTLRICLSCNKVQRSKTPQAFVSSEKSHGRRETMGASHSIDYTKLETLETPGWQRSNSLSGNAKHFTVGKREHKLEPAMVLEGRKIMEQAASCPKPAIGPGYFSKKWGGLRAANASVVTPAPSSAKLASAQVGLFRSSSETFSTPPHQPPSIPSHFSHHVRLDLQNNDREDEDKFESYTASYNSSLELGRRSSSYRRRAINDVKNKNSQNKGSDNQQSSSKCSTNNQSQQQDRPLIHRNFESLKMYEDIFLRFCENSASVRSSKYVALTLFTKSDKNQQDESENGGSTAQYLKVRERSTLLNTAANMRCCDPVLHLNKPIITRNTWALEGKLAVHPLGYDFRQLPIVAGPQQARFYAGVPLTDLKKRYRYGAIAIFDAAFNPGVDDDLPMMKTLQALQVCAREAVMAVDERRKDLELRTFLQAPLIQLRQSEPALHLSMDIPQSDLDWQDVESLDGDDDNDVDQSRFEDACGNPTSKRGLETPTTGSSSVGKARVEHFRSKMQELVRQAHDTQAQMVENTLVMGRHGVPIV